MNPCSEESRNWIRLLLFLCSKPDDLMIKSERSIREIDGGRSRMHIHPDVHTYIFPWFRHSGKNLELRKRETEIRRGTQGDQRTRRGERQSRRLSRREEKKKSALSSSVRLSICHVSPGSGIASLRSGARKKVRPGPAKITWKNWLS